MRSKEAEKRQKRSRRHKRVRKHVFGSDDRPRITVFKTSRHFYAQMVVDSPMGPSRTLLGVSTLSPGFLKDRKSSKGKIATAKALGEFLAEKAAEKGIKSAVFDRSGYPYHGRVKALAEGAREKGLEF
jgi:large subunit ribosomal protein L18